MFQKDLRSGVVGCVAEMAPCSTDWPWTGDFSRPVCIRKIPPTAQGLPWLLQSQKLLSELDTAPRCAEQDPKAKTVLSRCITGTHPASGLAKSFGGVPVSNLHRHIRKSACELLGRFSWGQLRAALSGSQWVLPKGDEAEMPSHLPWSDTA